jgi:hypothetical protein
MLYSVWQKKRNIIRAMSRDAICSSPALAMDLKFEKVSIGGEKKISRHLEEEKVRRGSSF